MINITKEESQKLRKRFGNDVMIAITGQTKKGKRKHYYTEETSKVRGYIERLRTRGGV